MRSLGWIILLSSLTALRSAQISEVKTGCPAPPEYPNTRLDRRSAGKKKFGDGEKVYYDCDEDFTPTRGSRAVQCVDGRWTKMTLKCEKRTCGNVGELPNGEFHYEGNSFVGERVYAVCDVGYTLKGLNYMICKKTGWTGEFPSCEEGGTTCSSPAVANSVSSAGDVPLHHVGDSVNFTCSQGFQLDGAPEIICGPDSQWDPQPPQCLPSPDKPSGCDMPLTVKNSNANIANRYIMKPSFASGDEVLYTCDVGYVSVGGSRYRRCINGKWTPLTLRCEKVTCPSPNVPRAFRSYGHKQQFQYREVVLFQCHQGYELTGPGTVTCEKDGQWLPKLPECTPRRN